MEFCCPPLPGASRLVKGSSHMCWILPSVLEDARVEEQEPLVSSLWWAAEVTVAVAVFWDFLGAFHHKCAFLSHARLMSRTLTSIWWVQITKIELIRNIINALDFYSKTMNVALGTAAWLKCIFTGAFSACLWIFKADLNWGFKQFFWSSNGSAEQLAFSHQEQAFCFKASRVVDSVCSRLDKWSLFGVTFLQGKAISLYGAEPAWTVINRGQERWMPRSLCDFFDTINITAWGTFARKCT